MKEFEDEQRKIVEKYYEIQDSLTDDNVEEIIEELKTLKKEDPYFLDSYLLIAELLKYSNKYKQAEKQIDDAYEKALELVTDPSGIWPDRLEWGWLENRHIIRTFVNMGLKYWQETKTLEAYALFSKLLETNPNDNPGVRYYMVAILENLSKNEFYARFENENGKNEDIEKWFQKGLKNHKKVFSQWLKEI
ncbi:MAG: hypothetical protein JXR63_03975 [Spirochaetales bacterium]|nr:hypothetical protein [Spirochaetales bacterium]